VNLLVSGEEETAVADAAGSVARWATSLVTQRALTADVLGPAPCAIGRIKNRYRWHVVLRSEPETIGRLVRYASEKLPAFRGVRVVMDRDPVSLL